MKGGQKMSNTLITTLVIASLLLGAFTVYAAFPREVVKEVTKEVKVNVPVENPLNEQIRDDLVKVNNELTTLKNEKANVQDPTDSIDVVFDRLGESDSFLTCGDLVYNLDQVLVSRIYNSSVTQIGKLDYKHSVTFTVKLAYDDESRNRNICYNTRTYKVTYEDGEKPIVNLI